jgi:ribosomal protein L37AE/L43A
MKIWTCPECGKLLCEDGFTTLECKIKTHLAKHEEELWRLQALFQ